MTIFVQMTDDLGYELMCQSHGMGPMPAGPRLFRAPPHPRVEFQHATIEAAESDARVVREYLAGLTTKRQTKKEIREAGE